MLISLSILIIIIFTCDRIRSFIVHRYNDLEDQQCLIKNVLLDVIGAIEMCSVSLELGVIFKHYGFWSFASLLFTNIFYQCLRWPNLHPPCPYFHIVNYISGKSTETALNVIIRCVVLVLSGLTAYHFIMTSIWTLELSETHVGRNKETSTEQCSVPGGEKKVLCLFIVYEFMGTFLLDIIINTFVVDNHFVQKRSPIVSAALISGMVVFAVSSAMDVSGGMFNPMLATVLVGGCDGLTTLEHIAIYWVSATMGAILASIVYPKIKQCVNLSGLKSPPPKKKKQ